LGRLGLSGHGDVVLGFSGGSVIWALLGRRTLLGYLGGGDLGGLIFSHLDIEFSIHIYFSSL